MRHDTREADARNGADARLDELIRQAVSTDLGPSPELDAALLASLDALETALPCPDEPRLWQLVSGAIAALLLTALLGVMVWFWVPSWPLRLGAWFMLTAPMGGLMLLLVALEKQGEKLRITN